MVRAVGTSAPVLEGPHHYLVFRVGELVMKFDLTRAETLIGKRVLIRPGEYGAHLRVQEQLRKFVKVFVNAPVTARTI